MIGPFGTYDQLPLAARMAYWTAVVVATYLGGLAVVHFVAHFLYGQGGGNLMGYALAGALAGIPLAALVASINWLVFAELSGFGFVTALPYTVATAALVSALVAFVSQRLTAAPAGQAPPPRPRLLDRLPTEKRGRIVRLSMQDHYVEVHTDRGSALILMRMSDAIAEIEGVDGLRIHRSHWVARDAVEAVERREGRLVLRLRGGVELPVSRSYAEAVRAAGIR
jgi:DNA-binding LytR/AlgR family response regulator